jgi:hypothetical protein
MFSRSDGAMEWWEFILLIAIVNADSCALARLHHRHHQPTRPARFGQGLWTLFVLVLPFSLRSPISSRGPSDWRRGPTALMRSGAANLTPSSPLPTSLKAILSSAPILKSGPPPGATSYKNCCLAARNKGLHLLLVSECCCLLPVACYLLPVTCCLLPVTCCLLPVACCLLPVAC